jgi:ABC-type polar amino acid transport system ATPase subunit
LITISNLVKHHGTRPILMDVSLTVQRGEVAVLIGPSGGGKSTLLRCVNGLETFSGGRIMIGTLTLHAGPAHEPALLVELRRQVGMVFQQFNLFPHWNVLENVLAGPFYALGEARATAEPRARQLLERVGLSQFVTARVEQLSGGQQQRVAIARALAVQPAVLLFDEPTSALDPRMADEVLRVIAELAQGGQTMMVVTHAMHFARQVGTALYVMDGGQIVEAGPPAQVFGQPQHATTQAFLSMQSVQ